MHSHFQRSSLVQQLAGALPAGAPAPNGAERQDVAERLGHWLSVVDAIRLQSAHATVAATARQAVRSQGQAPVNADALRADLARVREVLTQSIRQRHAQHRPDPQDLDTEGVFCLQAYQDQQRRMALSVAALREHARQALARGTPRQAQLAALDAALEQMLDAREQRLLGDLPGFLKGRWTALRKAAATTELDDHTVPPAGDGASDASRALQLLHRFNTELEQTLLAELEHRLQAVIGLIESLEP